MGTSLAEQLKKLAVPQTSLLIQDKKKRASLLFDPREAANHDRATVYDIGIDGLEELKKLNPKFGKFEKTLFNELSKDLERSVESQNANKKLDQEIKKFLILLSPYFLLKPSHKTLEWLINRFHIHKFNVDDLLILILPYHETRMFVRVIQLLDVKDPINRWHWLKPLQKPGVPLSKLALLNHCASDTSFLQFVCKMTLSAIKEYGSGAAALSTLYSFCCTTVVGALEHSSTISELQVTHILQLLVRCITCPVLDMAAACLIIIAQLARKTQLSESVLINIINNVCQSPHTTLLVESTMVLVLLYQTQEGLTMFPEKALRKLAKCPLFPGALRSVATSRGHITPLLVSLVKETLRGMQAHINNENKQELEMFAENLLTEMDLDNESAEAIIRTVIDSFDQRSQEIQTKPPKDKFPFAVMVDDDDEIVKFYTEYLHRLERQYPTVFDQVIRHSLYGNTFSNVQKKALRTVLGFCPEVVLNKGLAGVLEKLHHHNEQLRVEAVNCLVSNYSNLKDQDKELLLHGLRERLSDDSPSVVNAVLSFPPTVLTNVIGIDVVTEQLIALAGKFWCSQGSTLPVTMKTLQHLCSNVPSDIDSAAILLSVLPYLLPSEDSQIQLTSIVLASAFGKSNKFLRAVLTELADLSNFNARHVCSVVFTNMTRPENVPGFDVLTEAINKHPSTKALPVYKLLATILLTTSVSKQANLQQLWSVLDISVSYANSSQVVLVQKGAPLERCFMSCVAVASRGELPLQALVYCLTSLLKGVTLPQGQAWWDLTATNNSDKLLLIRIFDILIKGCSKGNKLKSAFTNVLKELFEKHFPRLPERLNFLSNLWVGHEIHNGPVDAELQLRSLMLGASLLRQSEEPLGWALKLSESNIVIPSLLVALSCPLAPLRVAALDCLQVLGKSISGNLARGGYIHLVKELLNRQEELRVDAGQLPVTLYTLLSPDPAVQCLIEPSQQPYMSKIVEVFLQFIFKKSPLYICSALLRMLAHVNSKELFIKLFPLGKKIIVQTEKEEKIIFYSSAILRNIVSRLDRSTCEGLKVLACWDSLDFMMRDCNTLVYSEDGKLIYPSVMIMDQISKEVFELIPSRQQQLLALLVSVGTDTESPDVVSAVSRMGKRIVIDCKTIVAELERMRDAKCLQSPVSAARPLRNRKSVVVAPSVDLLKTIAWRNGITLLELIQNKKKLHSVHLLLPVLFDILKRGLEFEEQASLEYTKQLLLSCVLHCCQKLSSDDSPVSTDLTDLPEKTLNVELVVQCIRSTQNPQTHHHALLVLSQMAGMIPKQVLHNIMAIFAFMGSSILRQDDAYSFQVISKIVETIVPILIKANDASTVPAELSNAVAMVLRVFVDALLDVPEHRRQPLFHKLLTTLGAQHFLWLLQCLVMESHILTDAQQVKRVDFILNLAPMFSPSTVITNCIYIVVYLQSLPTNKGEGTMRNKRRKNSKNGDEATTTALFDVERHSAKQLRHFKYSLTTYLASLLSSPNFINQVASLNEDDTRQMECLYTKLIENMLRYIQSVSHEADVNAGKPAAKYWKVMLNVGYDILDKVNALLPSDMFIPVVRGLLDNDFLTVRRKAMELLNARLQHPEFFATCSHEDLFTLLPPLMAIIRTITEESSRADLDQQLNQQTALLSVKLLARLLASDNPAHFKEILEELTELVKSKVLQGNILASTLLCVAELFSCLRAFSIGSLPKFMPALIKTLKKEKSTESPDVVLLGVVSAVHKIVESLPHFLSPYLNKLLVEVSILSARWQQDPENPKVAPILLKLKTIRQKVSGLIPPRVLVPSVSLCYSKLLTQGQFSSLGPLFEVLAGSFSELPAPELTQLLPDLTAFFLLALEFRAGEHGQAASPEEVLEAEGHVVQALVVLVLKLSESSFRPLYYSLFHWATTTDMHKDRIITFYRFSSSIAESLKGLFVLFAGHFLKNAAEMLDRNNTMKEEILFFGEAAEDKSSLLLEFVLKTLHSVFLYDSQNFINKERFETLMLPLVNQLENTLGGTDALQSRASSLLTPCIAQFAVDGADDVLWKQLIYQLLLKTRHNLPQVRLVALQTLCETARKLGEDFLPQLSETMPFLAELLEDEDETVEKACQRVIQDLEEILGEPLKKYF